MDYNSAEWTLVPMTSFGKEIQVQKQAITSDHSLLQAPAYIGNINLYIYVAPSIFGRLSNRIGKDRYVC